EGHRRREVERCRVIDVHPSTGAIKQQRIAEQGKSGQCIFIHHNDEKQETIVQGQDGERSSPFRPENDLQRHPSNIRRNGVPSLRGPRLLQVTFISSVPRLLPHLPGCLTPSVQVVKLLPVLECVHTVPVSLVLEGDQLFFLDQPLERLFHELFSSLHVLENVAPKDEEASV